YRSRMVSAAKIVGPVWNEAPIPRVASPDAATYEQSPLGPRTHTHGGLLFQHAILHAVTVAQLRIWGFNHFRKCLPFTSVYASLRSKPPSNFRFDAGDGTERTRVCFLTRDIRRARCRAARSAEPRERAAQADRRHANDAAEHRSHAGAHRQRSRPV